MPCHAGVHSFGEITAKYISPLVSTSPLFGVLFALPLHPQLQKSTLAILHSATQSRQNLYSEPLLLNMAPKKRTATTNTASRTKALKATSPLRTSPRKTRPSRKKLEAEQTTDIPAPSKVIKAKASPPKTKTPMKNKAAKTAKA